MGKLLQGLCSRIKYAAGIKLQFRKDYDIFVILCIYMTRIFSHEARNTVAIPARVAIEIRYNFEI